MADAEQLPPASPHSYPRAPMADTDDFLGVPWPCEGECCFHRPRRTVWQWFWRKQPWTACCRCGKVAFTNVLVDPPPHTAPAILIPEERVWFDRAVAEISAAFTRAMSRRDSR